LLIENFRFRAFASSINNHQSTIINQQSSINNYFRHE